MENRLEALEQKVAQLAGRVDQLEQRLAGAPLSSVPQAWPLGEATLPGPAGRTEVGRWVTYLGRSCLVLGGAFLIRALTDARVLPGALGVALGIGFATIWILFAHRAATAGATVSAGFHAGVAALIAYPLILESATRLGAMSTSAAALVLVVFTVLLLAVSRRDRLGWVAWVGALSCVVTALALGRIAGAWTEATAVLLVLAAATFFWPGEDWGRLRWAPAVALDLVVLRAVLGSGSPGLVVPLALAGLSVGLALARTARRDLPVGTFEGVQSISGLAIGVLGALRFCRETGTGTTVVAGGLLATALVTTVFAARVVPRRGNRELDFAFYAALSLALVASAVCILAEGEVRGALWAVLALAAVLLGRRSHPVTLWSLAALLALGAAASCGLGAGMWQALAGRDPGRVRSLGAGSLTVLGLILLAYLATVPSLRSVPTGSDPGSTRIPAAVLLLLVAGGLASLAVEATRSLSGDLGRLASVRIVVASVLATALALIRRRVPCPELFWIATVALGLGGIELVLVELPNGRPLTLLVSFVVYGAALILVSRLAPPARDLHSPQPPDDRMVTRS